MARLNAAGDLQWAQQFGTTGNDTGEGIVVDSMSRVYVAGHTSGDLAGNASAGQADVFVTYVCDPG